MEVFMMKNNKYELVSGVVFGVIAGLQAIRAILQVPAQVGTHDVPLWISWMAVAVAGTLSMWAFQTARHSH
jgi:hypothetical protein